MEWIESEWKDKIDFVVWTGDSARHDNDEEIPRNAGQVVGLNELMVQKMSEVFGKKNGDEGDEDPNNDYVIPIIPNLGNNDVLPHNVMGKGPNTWTRTYTKVWRQFIPEAQKHSFEQGGWFYVEVIPNKLAVFSLNTLYFFEKNAAVDGCALPKEPGYQQMEWLRIQLQFMRERGVKAILTGHVPPIREQAKTLWDETCWQKYTLWLQQYRDVIVGSLYGHFNYDHFLLQDFDDLEEDTKNGRMPSYNVEHHADDDDEMHPMISADYWLQLREDWSDLPEPPKSLDWLDASDDLALEDATPNSKKGKKEERKKRKKQRKFLKKIGGRYAERFAASFVSASVVPNLFPTMRVYEYNTSGLEQQNEQKDPVIQPPAFVGPPDLERESTRKKKKNRKYKFKVPEAPSKSSPPGPAYSPQSLSLLKYTQYYANITHINNDFQAIGRSDTSMEKQVGAQKWREGKHKGKRPHDKDHSPQPKSFKFQVHYDTREDDVYHLKDLTMPSLVDLARRIGNFKAESDDAADSDAGSAENEGVDAAKRKKKHKKHKHGKHTKRNEAWYTFIRRAFVETMPPEEIEEDYGH